MLKSEYSSHEKKNEQNLTGDFLTKKFIGKF